MTMREIAELLLAAFLIGAGIYLYRRPSPEPDHYGSQGAVILFVIALILAIHGLGLLRYHPTQTEIDASHRR